MSDISDILRLRRELHRIPELAGKEYETSALIRKELSKTDGIRILPPFLETDVVAFIDGARPGRNLTLRADIDALSVEEKTGVDFASCHNGLMHACGHDVHTAILIAAAKAIASRRDKLTGSVRLVFQPGEESVAMAEKLAETGALSSPPPDLIAALHLAPGLQEGVIGMRCGCMASSCLHYEVVFSGKSGHGSMPHLARNPLLAAVAAIGELQYVKNTVVDPRKSAVLSICMIHGGDAENVIPDRCSFAGTLRAFDNETADMLISSLRDICKKTADIHKLDCEVSTHGVYPVLTNSAKGVEYASEAVKKAGLQSLELPMPDMSSEDFGYLASLAAESVFVRLGAGENVKPLHSAEFMPPESIIRCGMDYFTSLAEVFLGK